MDAGWDGFGLGPSRPGIIRVSDDSGLPEIPRGRPPTERERNAVAKRVAVWLLRNGFRAGLRLSPLGRAAVWLYEFAPLVDAYLDPPKTLEELQRGLDRPRAGYDKHHIVETNSALADGFRLAEVESRDNLVLIPRLKHWQITVWYMTRNDDFGGVSPREYLRGRSWAERRRLGLDALVRFGVLKP